MADFTGDPPPDPSEAIQADRPAGRWLVLTAAMGAGHTQVAAQLARGIRGHGGEARCIDVLELLPLGIGRAVRGGYAQMLRRAPWLYEAIFAAFFRTEHPAAPGVYPLDVLAGHRLRPLLEDIEGVVSTFHLAGQIAGRLRCRGLLHAPSVVALTEPALHRQWIHPGTDLYLCPYPWLATAIHDRTGTEALAPGPVVDPRFHLPADTDIARTALGLREGEHAVLVSAGGWGTGAVAQTAAVLTHIKNVRPVVLCGRNRGLRADIARIPGCSALGWRDDLPRLFAGARVLIDQSGGGTCAEAFAAGLPVIVHQPLPGHGRLAARTLADHGLVTLAHTPEDLFEQVRQVLAHGPTRRFSAADIFTADPVSTLLDWRPRSKGSGSPAPCRRRR